MIPQPYRILVVVLLWLASIVAVGAWQRHDGAATTEAEWQKREAATQARAASDINALQARYRTAEQKNAADMAAAAAAYERRLTHANKQRAVDIAAVRAGTLRLYDRSATVPACSGPAAEAGAAPGERDGPAAGELSGELTEFLVSEANRADDTVRQLQACQQVISLDRQ